MESMDLETASGAPITLAAMQRLLEKYMGPVAEHTKQIAEIRTELGKTGKRVERIDRNAKETAVCIFNFPSDKYAIDPKSTNKSEIVRRFLMELMKIDKADTEFIQFRLIKVYPSKTPARPLPMVWVDFVSGDDKDLCWNKVKELADFNKTRSAGQRVSWQHDRTEEQQETAKKRRLEGSYANKAKTGKLTDKGSRP